MKTFHLLDLDKNTSPHFFFQNSPFAVNCDELVDISQYKGFIFEREVQNTDIILRF